MIFSSSIALMLGFILDQIVGDPKGWPHMVRGIGALISWFEKRLYSMQNKRFAGILLVILTLMISTGVPAVLFYVAWHISKWVYIILESLICWQCLACKSLKSESQLIYFALTRDDLPGARSATSMIVGRDTASLDASGMVRAAVETVAENASDGVVAPLCYLMLGGAVFGCFYKAVNTMDSMIGYQNKHYCDFGHAAAKLDDAVNYIPARLSAFLMIVASYLCRLDVKNAYLIWRRDRRKHDSPNSAQTEAVMAGALRVRLAGDAYYAGELHKKQFIGDDIRAIEKTDILRAQNLLIVTAWLAFGIVFFLKGCVYASI